MILLVEYTYPKNHKVTCQHYAANDIEKREVIENYVRRSKAIDYKVLEERR